MDYLNIRIRNREIIYDGKVKKTYNGQGIVRVKDTYLGKRAYIIFPLYRQDDGEDVIVAVERGHGQGDQVPPCSVLAFLGLGHP